jgi:hypothetical protein
MCNKDSTECLQHVQCGIFSNHSTALHLHRVILEIVNSATVLVPSRSSPAARTLNSWNCYSMQQINSVAFLLCFSLGFSYQPDVRYTRDPSSKFSGCFRTVPAHWRTSAFLHIHALHKSLGLILAGCRSRDMQKTFMCSSLLTRYLHGSPNPSCMALMGV